MGFMVKKSLLEHPWAELVSLSIIPIPTSAMRYFP